MLTSSLQFDDLLAPHEIETFLRDTWEKEPLIVNRGDEGAYRGLFCVGDLDAVIAYSRPQFDPSAFEPVAARPATYIRGVLGGQAPPLPGEQPSIAELRQHYEQGKSLVIMGMQHRWPAIAELCRNLETVFHAPVHANMYLTPPGSQGFAAHYDTHEVFVLQLDGTKHWRLYGVAEELPLATDSVSLLKKPSTKPREITLGAGDLLYIPRGHVHEASTADGRSLHLTVGVNVYRWADLLLQTFAHISRRDVAFRRSIPGGALPADRSQLKAKFKELVERWAAAASADDAFEHALDMLADQFMGQLEMLPCGQFAGHDNCDVGLDSLLERDVRAVCRVVEGDQGVAIVFPGNRVAGPHRIAAALRFVAAARRFKPRDLPGELSDDGKLVLVRRLMREGLLRVVSQTIPDFFFPGAKLSEENHASDVTTGQLAEAVGHARGQGLVG